MINKAVLNMRHYREKQLMLKAQRKKAAFKHDDAVVQSEEVDTIQDSSIEQNIELRLQSHLDELKDIRAKDKRNELKKEWLNDYLGYIDACLAVSPATQNTVLMHLLVWAVDSFNLPLSLRICQFALLNNMVMPEGYKRTPAEFVSENIAETCIANPQLAFDNSEQLQALVEMVHGEDMTNEAHAKLYRALGMSLEASHLQQALIAYQTALRLDARSGVKALILKLERQLKTESTSDQSGSQDIVTSQDDSNSPVSTASNDEVK